MSLRHFLVIFAFGRNDDGITPDGHNVKILLTDSSSKHTIFLPLCLLELSKAILSRRTNEQFVQEEQGKRNQVWA